MNRYDVIGDIHGCYDELADLVATLGYRTGRHPDGRRLVFVGDLVDRGPASDRVLELVMSLVAAGDAFAVLGNHDSKLARWLASTQGKMSRALRVSTQGKMPRALRVSIEQIAGRGEGFQAAVHEFLLGLPYRFEDGGLLVVHGAYRPGLDEKQEQKLALYGEMEQRRFGYVRGDQWAHEYAGAYAVIVRGHAIVAQPTCITSHGGTRMYNVDTGCVFGGHLTALRYPEESLVQVKARQQYYRRGKPRGVGEE